MSIETEIDRLEHQLRMLKVEFDKYFCGALPIPPEPLREELRLALKKLRGRGGKTAVDRFRLTNLEANFNSVSELLNRRVRNREMGVAPAVRRQAPVPQAPDSRVGVVFGQRKDEQALTSLYKDLYGKRGAQATDLESFREYVSNQVDRIRDKTGCKEVQFRVAEENGKLKLKAKAIKGDA